MVRMTMQARDRTTFGTTERASSRKKRMKKPLALTTSARRSGRRVLLRAVRGDGSASFAVPALDEGAAPEADHDQCEQGSNRPPSVRVRSDDPPSRCT
jgi:hypothetical protein